jgi:hypothetical protein
MDRRSFLKNGSLSALVVGNGLSWLKSNPALATHQVQSLSFRITEAIKEMVTHNAINEAKCPFWIYKEESFPAECPGPIIFAEEGESIQMTITNDLNEDHAFSIPGIFDSGPIRPNQTKSFTFIATRAGTYLYHDNLNAPVNRVMGLHGAFIVMPRVSAPGQRFTPYSNPTPEVQRLFNDLGRAAHFPGLSWEEGDRANGTGPFRQHIWILHEASPKLFEEVRNYPAGRNYPARRFINAFSDDAYANTFETGVFNRKPHFFTINGQSGFFGHHNPYITPTLRVGEPTLIRVLNAGLLVHSLHLHANHFYNLSSNNRVHSNVAWYDTYQLTSGETQDWVVPVTRPPDVPNERGIGLPDRPLVSLRGRPVWPPQEEMNLFLPEQGRRIGNHSIAERFSPLCYPMHDHIETAQTSQGGNYPLGMMSGLLITGDRSQGQVVNFPDYSEEFEVNDFTHTRKAAPDII